MRYPILALLATSPAHGYELKQALEQRFGPVLPPLNAGQIYTTLSRLERDGLVAGDHVTQDGRPNKTVYSLTPDGRSALDDWIERPAAGPKLRDEFFTKLVLAGMTGAADPLGLIERQRREYLQSLRDLGGAEVDPDSPASLLVEGAALHLQADLKWLDLCEERLLQEDGNGSRNPR
jgi:DNA-binding PadR family transcriptional regulator